MKMNLCLTSFFVISLALGLFVAESHDDDISNCLRSLDVSQAPSSDYHSCLRLKKVIPAVYVFGDSLTDSGNNNYLQTKAKANFLPYGIDFNNTPTGRFTNGRTFADIIAESAHLPFPPPYMGLSEYEKKTITTGVNFASGSSGVLPDTGKVAGSCLFLDKQIDLFRSLIENGLKSRLKILERVAKHLKQSLVIISAGSNDVVLNYGSDGSPLKQEYNPLEFAQYLAEEYSKRL